VKEAQVRERCNSTSIQIRSREDTYVAVYTSIQISSTSEEEVRSPRARGACVERERTEKYIDSEPVYL
jgi:hypothetical protein